MSASSPFLSSVDYHVSLCLTVQLSFQCHFGGFCCNSYVSIDTSQKDKNIKQWLFFLIDCLHVLFISNNGAVREGKCQAEGWVYLETGHIGVMSDPSAWDRNILIYYQHPSGCLNPYPTNPVTEAWNAWKDTCYTINSYQLMLHLSGTVITSVITKLAYCK